MVHKTFDGIQHWYKHEYMHLGWMVLAKAQGHTEKVEQYKHSLYRLLNDISETLNVYEDPDKLRDLQVLYDDTLVLYNFAKQHL